MRCGLILHLNFYFIVPVLALKQHDQMKNEL